MFLPVGQCACAGMFGGYGLWQRLTGLNQTFGDVLLWNTTAPAHLWPWPYKFAVILNMPAVLAGNLFSPLGSAHGPGASEAVGGIASLLMTLPLWYWIGHRFDRPRGCRNNRRLSFRFFLSTLIVLSLLGALLLGPIFYLLYGIALWMAAVFGIARSTRSRTDVASF
jgi:hypothetical protein